MDIKFNNSKSKIKVLIDSISSSVMQGRLKVGDNLPSINEASSMYAVSRDTVFKAYIELKKRGVIDAIPKKGYFVSGEVNHVLLLLDTYTSFKQGLYHRFMEKLPDNYKVDLIFHQYSEPLFETIVNESIGKYSMYVVMNFSYDHLSDALKAIPINKLLLLDFGHFEKSAYSYICQDFDKSFFDCLSSSVVLLKKYSKFAFVFPEELCHPICSIDSFVRFCKKSNLAFEVFRKDSDWHGVEAGTVYFCISREDMVKIIKEADLAGLSVGSDLGLIAYNDEPILEVIEKGVSAISVDFGLMGEWAANFVINKQQIQEYLPTQFIQRNSI
ncbi:MAG: GntR family transcriptional regulator [Bacteroidia bacterium]|nr:GntR family transcriptional regulator [Bacteroidia bacterium]